MPALLLLVVGVLFVVFGPCVLVDHRPGKIQAGRRALGDAFPPTHFRSGGRRLVLRRSCGGLKLRVR